MAKKDIKAKKGFTIIEVVLVLAIAGLIFLMVFVALPALQRSQRDTQRRNDMSRFISQLSQYQANNAGKVPNWNGDAWDEFIENYLRVQGDTFSDPSGTEYEVKSLKICESGTNGCPQQSSSDGAGSGWIRVYSNATCDGESPKYSQGDTKIAITYKLEGAGIYCGHN